MDRKDLKPTLLLALMLFLICAPAPDGETVMEATHNFIVPKQESSLQASVETNARAQDLEVGANAEAR